MTDFSIQHQPARYWMIAIAAFVALVAVVGISSRMANAADATIHAGEHILTIHDNGEDRGFITKQTTFRAALQDAGVRLDDNDMTEPSLDDPILSDSYEVNIYRARPVVIRDGKVSTKLITAYRTGKQIAKQAGLVLNDADITKLMPSKDPVADGAGEILTIDYATPLTFIFYGKQTAAATRTVTVGDFLHDKGVTPAADDTLVPSVETPISAGMTIQLWKNGKQTVTVDEDIAFTTRQINDANRDKSYKEIQTAGANGKRTVTYEIIMQNGKEVSRKEVNAVVVKPATEQVEVIGVKGMYTTPSQNESITWAFLIDKGLTREQTAGIMGNLKQEHGFQTSGDGLAQWTGSRLSRLQTMYPDSSTTIQSQLDYLWYELSGPYSKVLANIRAQTTVEGAVVVFQNQYERCGVCVENRRIQFAYDILASH